MNAIAFDRHGSPADVLQLRELPKPVPARGEVLVRMIASPINPSDLLYIEGRYGLLPSSFPCVPGFEGVGVVEASGGGLLGLLRKGKRVAVLGTRGIWSEYAIASARQVVPVPPDIPDEQAAGFFVNPMTALALVDRVLKVPAGAWLLQSAANGALGKMIVRLGKKRGFRTINVVRREDQVDELKRLGADEVIVESAGPIPDRVRGIIGSDGVGFALDPVGGTTGTQIVQSLGSGGRCILYGLLSGEPVSVDPRFLITGSKRVEGFWLADWVKRQGVLTLLGLTRRIRGLLADGTFATETAATFPLNDFAKAIELARQPGRRGKVLLTMADARRL